MSAGPGVPVYNNWHLWLPDASDLLERGGPDLQYVVGKVGEKKGIPVEDVTLKDIAKQLRLSEKEKLRAIIAFLQRPLKKRKRKLPPVPKFVGRTA